MKISIKGAVTIKNDLELLPNNFFNIFGANMWPFRKKEPHKSIFADITSNTNGSVNIDVRGQTCPGYLLAINKAMESLEMGTEAFLITTYAPCGDDVKAWCNEKGYTYEGIEQGNNLWKIGVIKN